MKQLGAAMLGISAEPLWQDLELQHLLRIKWQCSGCRNYFGSSAHPKVFCPSCGKEGYWTGSHAFNSSGNRAIDWVITGVDSSKGGMQAPTDWMRNLQKQCAIAGSAFFLKQTVVNGIKTSMPRLDGQQWSQMPAGYRVEEKANVA